MMYDKINPVNSAGIEVLCKWAYGYEKATEFCSKKEHWAGNKAQQEVRWDLLDRVDLLWHRKSGASVARVHAQLTDNLKRDALFNKYYEKSKTN